MNEERTLVGGVEVATGHFINNQRVSSATTFEDRSPLDWSLKLANVARGTSTHDADLALGGLGGLREPGRTYGVTNAASTCADWPILIDDNVGTHRDRSRCLDMAMLEESLRRARHRPRGAQLPRLRRSGRALRVATLGVQRNAQHGSADARRTDGGDHAVERALHVVDLEVRPGARCGQHGGPETGRVVPAQLFCADGPRPRGRVFRPACSTSSRASVRRSARRW
jgi:hypothetical protein